MNLLQLLLLSLSILSSYVSAQSPDSAGVQKEKHLYQSDVARLRKIVISSIYSHREVFLRELVSNANDALEKLRLTALTDKALWNGADSLNITIKAVKNADGGGQIIISDTGIGMTSEELTTNLGTLAKSGTSDFLTKAENQNGVGNGNLIGAFGLGFYSSFLVSDRVYVSSIAPKSEKNPNPIQYVFSSSSDDPSFDIYPDPRGNTLGRGTEITLVLKEDALEYLDPQKLTELVNKHSSFSTTFPIFLFSERFEEVPHEDSIESPVVESPEGKRGDDDEATVEEVLDKAAHEEDPSPKMKSVLVEEWVRLNSQPPLWMRDPKTITDEEYTLFYQATFKDFAAPLAWHHFSGDSGSGVSFRAIIYVPSKLSDSYWQSPAARATGDIRLMVKRVLITSDLGEEGLPKWASWVKAVVDADDLPLTVSRETLQSTRFLKQLKQSIIKRLVQTFTRISEDEEKFADMQKSFGSVLKLGAIDDQKNRNKLVALTRYSTNQRTVTSLDQYLENKKQGQKQIFYLAELGKSAEELAQSVFVEKLSARGYEVLLFREPLDEILIQNIRSWKGFSFQDVAKAGLKFGDEDSYAKEEREQQKELTEKFKPLLEWLKAEAKDVVTDVVISNRLVSSPCAIVADINGYTANVEKLMSTSNNQDKGFMHEFAKKQKLLEINPRSPLMEGLLRRVQQLPSEEEGKDLDAEDELKEVASILIDGALVRSGFDVSDSNGFFSRVDRVLRRSLGVSETAPTDTTVKPAPPVDPELPEEESDERLKAEEDSRARVIVPDNMKDKISIEMEEVDENGNPVHDEL
jgi:heat shock protein beta